MATIPVTTTVTVTRMVPIESLSVDERKQLIKQHCSLKEIQDAINHELFPLDYLLALAASRAQHNLLDF